MTRVRSFGGTPESGQGPSAAAGRPRATSSVEEAIIGQLLS